MEVPGKRKCLKGLKEVYGGSEGGHAGSRYKKGRCRGWEEMQPVDPLWRPLTGEAERRR